MATQITNELEGVVAKVNTFTEPGRYSILYKAYEALACADSVFLSNYINAGKQPTALFNFEPAEAEVWPAAAAAAAADRAAMPV